MIWFDEDAEDKGRFALILCEFVYTYPMIIYTARIVVVSTRSGIILCYSSNFPVSRRSN